MISNFTLIILSLVTIILVSIYFLKRCKHNIMFKLKRTKICLIAASTWRPPLFDIPIFWKNSCWDSIKIWCKNLYSGREGRTEFILFLASGYHLVSTNLTEILYNSGSNPGEECLRKGTWHEISIEDHEEKN